ncbi:MAG: CPBP family intramembrane metalloprotease [Candidatus Cloacimonetes bacterium]|nr:CPBP family intramembrane metalloprotease [Candidatus Cloacimonadota bacterium]
MNFKKAFVIYKKEMLELFRDKRTLFTTIILPVILYPLLFAGFGAIMTRQADVLEKRGATVAFQDSLTFRTPETLAIRDSIYEDLTKIEHFQIIPAPPTLNLLYQEGDIDAIVTIKDSLNVNQEPVFLVTIRYDGSGEKGLMVYHKLESSLLNTSQKISAQRLQALDIDQQIIKPMEIMPLDTSTTEKKMGNILGTILPYLMILLLITGASVVAADLVAGEKERQTLETLLVSSVSRSEIVLGKYLTIVTMAMVNVIINLVSISFSIQYLLSQSGLDMQGIQMPINSFLILLLAMIPLATLFAAILLSISTFSRNMKEARTYEQPIIIIAMLMGMISFLPTVEMNNVLALVPVINVALLFKVVLIGNYQLSHLLLTIGSTLVLDVIAIWITVKLFNTESVLFRTQEEGGKIKIKNKRTFFSPFYGIVYFCLALAALYYLGGKWQAANLVNGLIQSELMIILFPVLILLRLGKYKPAEILRLKKPKAKELAIIPFMAISASMIVSIIAQVINHFFPFPQEYIEAMSRIFTQDISFWEMFIVIALLPGICEEILFRGFLMRFFEQKNFWYPIFVTAILFALFHLDPFRFLPVLLLGILLGYITRRTGSIVNSMFFHIINNTLALVITTFSEQNWMRVFIQDGENLKYWLTIPAILIFILSLTIFNKITILEEV